MRCQMSIDSLQNAVAAFCKESTDIWNEQFKTVSKVLEGDIIQSEMLDENGPAKVIVTLTTWTKKNDSM